MKNGHVEEHELAARVMLMVGEKWHEAELQLEPQGMGKIRVQLSIDQEQQTNVQFMVQHSQAKEALDQSLPRLRELLIQHGLQPGQWQITVLQNSKLEETPLRLVTLFPVQTMTNLHKR
jgi:flagellar hook-length control protein FliK